MEPIIKNLPVLLIDGNYFGHRSVHGLNKGGDFTLNSTLEMMQFEEALYTQLIGLYKSFNNEYHTLINNIIFVFDGQSWRKEVTPHKPYYVDENEKLGYKENRVENKADSINWDNWRTCLENFAERVSLLLPVFKIHGAEGDDSLLLLTKYFTSRQIMSIVFCTDGDLKQLIDDKYVIVYRNTKSKDLPNGEIVISKYLASKYFDDNSSPMDKLMGRSGIAESDRHYLSKIFNMLINGGGVVSNANRTLGNGVSTPNYKTDAFVKCICGDKKDNIFPIFRWKSGGASARNMSVTEKMMIKALKVHNIELNDDSLELMLSDTVDGKDLFINLLLGLQDICNQKGISKNITKHYEHNQLLNILNIDNIPQSVVEAFKIKLKDNMSLINRVLDSETLMVNNKKLVSDSADIIKTSIDTHTYTDNQTEIKSNPEQTKMLNEIDDILNS